MLGPFSLLWKAKRIIKNGAYGGGDLGLDDIRVSECTSADIDGEATPLPLGTIYPTGRKHMQTFIWRSRGNASIHGCKY